MDRDGRSPKLSTYKTGPGGLGFFSTFEVLNLPIKGPMEVARVVKLYEPPPTVCGSYPDSQNMVGRVPLIPYFLAGNSTPTIPHMLGKRRDSSFPFGCADSVAVDGRRGSNVHEVNLWLWQFGRKAALGWSDDHTDYGEEERCSRCTAQEGSGDETASQGGSGLI